MRVDRRSFGSVQIHRNNKSYAFLLGVCRLLHDCLSVDAKTGRVRFAGVPEDHLAALYEAFVRGFYTRELRGWEVSHPRYKWHAAERQKAEGPLLPEMQTDVILRGQGRRMIVDAKYYDSPFQIHHDKATVHSEHLYQIVTYLANAALAEPGGPPWEGMLLSMQPPRGASSAGTVSWAAR